MSNAIITQKHKAVIQEYLSQNQDATIQVPILGHRWSSSRSVLYRLVWKTDYWNDPTYNPEERMRVLIEGRWVTLIIWVNDADDTTYLARSLRRPNIFLLVYDVTDRYTFEYIKKVHAELSHFGISDFAAMTTVKLSALHHKVPQPLSSSQASSSASS
ncbi:hypothetical protein EDB81DRAFT_795648 [Dactylonectria macrodidyma]|uniref:Uncharacterized protein n=1 Tax=Dactylonectria macrodidyma TaxID=307937 RepID=A0A9P9J6A5_9HYPO|nr:hypothetical protein EDB81DRAFT_795648 [Dactylonectria macrodidyma]